MEAGKLPEEAQTWLDDAQTRFEVGHQSFGHGILHGGFVGTLFALSILGTKALFECKKCKYILINTGYQIASLAVKAGISCQYVP